MGNKTDLFAKHLLINHNLTIPFEKHNYLLISLNGCSGCIQMVINRLKEGKQKNKNTTIIFSFISKKLPSEITYFNNCQNVFFEKMDQLKNMNLGVTYPCLVITENKKIITIIMITPENINYVFSRI